MIPVLETRGSGVGTRRTYDDAAVFVATSLVRLAQLGLQGEDLKIKARIIENAWRTYRPAEAPLYLVGLAPGSLRGLVFTRLASSPAEIGELLQESPGGAAYIVDLHGLAKQIA